MPSMLPVAAPAVWAPASDACSSTASRSAADNVRERAINVRWAYYRAGLAPVKLIPDATAPARPNYVASMFGLVAVTGRLRPAARRPRFADSTFQGIMANPSLVRVFVACHIAAAGLLLASCDKAPTQPGNPPPPPPPGPTVQRSTGPIAFVSNRDGADAIYLANEDGSAVTKLTAGLGPTWSRNGPQIAFWSNWNIYAINVDGSGLRFVIEGTYPAVSPDGRSLAFSSGRDDSEIDAVNLDGSARRSLFDSGGYGSFGPKWSPDGQRIVFSIGTVQRLVFWVVDGERRRLRCPAAGRAGGRPAVAQLRLRSRGHLDSSWPRSFGTSPCGTRRRASRRARSRCS